MIRLSTQPNSIRDENTGVGVMIDLRRFLRGKVKSLESDDQLDNGRNKVTD
jgi:uncharacterized protein (DUF488 family)